ncbi:MAG: hypothetical protein QOI51_2589 [Nocardioidaceae bacterium]|jgi:thiol-disulfide isomerase/thioredoxin|nr:hypothetical protein [Nocardioidaceae bacterium]MDX6308102.1 hypothetical protein [Nocardioidaceae bacterium]
MLVRRFAAAVRRPVALAPGGWGARLVVPLVAAALLAATVSGCSTSGASSNSDGLVLGAVNIIAPADRKAAPDLSGALVGGGHADLSSDAGRVVVLNVWASWCVPCRAEAPGLVEAAKLLPKVAFMGIDIRNDESSAESFTRTYHVPYPSFFDQDSSLLLRLQQVVPVPAQPVTIILDKRHRVAASIYGTTTSTTLKDIIRPLERER